MAYTAYVLSEATREELAKVFKPKYERFIGHHVTVQFGVGSKTPIPEEADIRLACYYHDDDGLEAFSVTVNGQEFREDGEKFHITWSLDPSLFVPKDSNELVKNNWRGLGLNSDYQLFKLETIPAICI